ncbi:Tcp11-domain-containing protein [Aureobasidium subglaciale]|nr:Tcp11-domain-containing protein [Aureobasidium subglaciale]KAI5226845.1 Tcp11-domain-containing protein [Aureobasidium subglaciale]KAI5230142.1 Tcp11-domain-containing protein [Aureobasidium subglaciale]KAI5264671.1 Tcp11-domain-containing protein [Aureobasidium subglaciale]
MSLLDDMAIETPEITVDNMSEDEALSSDLPDFDVDGQGTIPEEDDFDSTSMVIMSDDAGQVYAPPDRIAARFYRDPKPRHFKSSAASSRRNSLSSIQSHTSTRSLRRTSSCQSNYIAQHLRRASIIEARKARLADRAAHAEKVRLRAAMAKAAPRGDASASEGRALAAQLAREKKLAKVAAACAEEVQRAKQKAQEIKTKKLEEEKQARLDMEEKMADADRRRAEYKRNMTSRKSRRASEQEKKLADVSEGDDDTSPALNQEEMAARRIQRAWRVRQRRLIVRAYTDFHLSLEGIRHHSFEHVGSLLSGMPIIQATTKVLRLLNLQDKEDSPSPQATRTFLSAYLVILHPASVLSKNGAQEQHLNLKARDLITLFESVMSTLSLSNRFQAPVAMLQDLSQAYTTYVSAFDAWRAQDSSALVETMIASFVELDAIWQTVKDDTRGAVAEDYRQGIRDNQVMFLSKIRKLAGPERADLLIKKAIRESRRRRVKRRSAAEVRPRAAADIEDAEPDSSETLPIVAPPLPQNSVQTGTASQDDVRSNLARLFSPIPSNRILTHELAIDKDFRISSGAHSGIRDAINRELCNGMREGVERGMGTPWTVAMAQEIRAKLVHIVKPGNSMHNFIIEALDTDLIYRQCEQGIFSYANFFSFMANILPKLCAPFRDAQIKTLADDLVSNNDEDMGTMIEKLFRLLHFIDLLSLDYSNFLLMNAAPVLIRESAGYESRMFAADLASGAITLACTDRWWRNASVNLLTEADRRDPEQVRNPADRPTAHHVYTRGLVDIAFGQGPLNMTDVPETLALDVERLCAIRQKALHMTTIGSVLLVAKNMLKRDVRSPWKAEASRLWDLLSKEPPSENTSEDALASLSSRAFGVLESAHNLPPSTKSALQSAASRVITQASSQRFTDPVAKVLYSRLRSHVLSRVVARTSSERVRTASGASEALATAGLPEFVTQVGEMVETLRKVAEVDWASHSVWYEQVAREVSEAGDA